MATSPHELQEQDLDKVAAGLRRQVQIAVVVRSSDQTVTQTGSHLDVIVNNIPLISRPLGR
jgi:hypothetical protein